MMMESFEFEFRKYASFINSKNTSVIFSKMANTCIYKIMWLLLSYLQFDGDNDMVTITMTAN